LSKKRLDILLTEQQLTDSRNKAQTLIMQGKVFVNGEKITKPGLQFKEDCEIHVKEEIPFVSRGAYKLEKALDTFSINPQGKTAVDIGSSTGGFTDLLLKRGASKVYAVDVGTNQLAYSLRIDPRVVVMENTNARFLKKTDFTPPPVLAVTDVSFISLSLILPVIKELNCLETIALIKPQFEIGREIKNFDGVVRKQEDREKAIEKVKAYALELDFKIQGIAESPIQGPKGNVEYLIYLKLEDNG